jgi:hypothetical protein
MRLRRDVYGVGVRRAARTDRNQAEIVAALRAAGATVWVASGVGRGFPDLLVTHRDRLHLLEVKDGKKPPSARRLTPDELAFAREHPVAVVCSVAEALEAIGLKVAA